MLELVSLRKKVFTRSRKLGCGSGGRSSEGARAAGTAGSSAAGEGAGFTCPRNTTAGRSRTSRTSRIVSGAGSGGGSGEFALKLSGGMRTVYTGSPAEAEGGGTLSVLLRFGSNGGAREASSPKSRSVRECAGVADLGASIWARG